MEKNEKLGCTTRSQARLELAENVLEKPSSELTTTSLATTCAVPCRSGVLPASSSRNSSRSSREAARLRAEYEAEKEIVMMKTQLIKKKLAADIAELEDEEWGNSQCGSQVRVEEWLNSREDTIQPSGNPSNLLEPEARAAPPYTGMPPAPRSQMPRGGAPSVVATRPTPPHPRAHPPPLAPVASGDVLQLADVIITSMAKQRPKQNSDLPLFDGNPVDWIAYRRAYDSTASTYNTYENTVRLQTSLRGAAKYAVEDLLRTGSDPELVIEALEEEFGHPNLLLETALNKIRKLPKVSDSGIELRHLTSVVRNCVFILTNIRAEGYINNPQLTNEILSKLTPVQRLQYGEYAMRINRRDGVDLRISPNLNVVLDFLSHLSRASAYYLPVCTSGVSTEYTYRNRSNAAAGPRNTAAGAGGGCSLHTDKYRRTSTHRVCASVEATPAETAASGARHDVVMICACDKEHLITECEVFAALTVDEKWDFARNNKLCFRCLIKQHSRYHCNAKRCDKCRSLHHTLLHSERSFTASSERRDGDARRRPGVVSAVAELAHDSAPSGAGRAAESAPAARAETVTITSVKGERSTHTLLKIMPVTVSVNDSDVKCYALLDDGATVSLIDSSVYPVYPTSSELSCPLKIITASGEIVTDDKSCRVTALIKGPNGISHSIILRTMKNINLPPQNVPATVFTNNAHLRNLDFGDLDYMKPLLLIGQDNWELIVNQEIRRGKSGQPVASLTKLGWVVHGPLGVNSVSVNESVNFVSGNTDNLYDLVKEQFELESIGISEVSRKNVETERAYKILGDTSRRIEGGWEVGLLWSRDEVNLPDNYDYARKRLAGIERKMDRDPSYAEAYTKQIQRLIDEKYARLVVEPLCVNPVWWLPHFGVTNPNKPGKLRLVYDATATYQGTCLNDHLLTGPDLLNSLLGILFRFRCGPVAYTADIADMFLRIKIRKEDQGAQLFLWTGGDRKGDPDTYVMDSMIFGAKSSPTTAVFILNKNASEFQDTYPEAVKAIHDRHYMDDYLDSVNTVDKARQLIQEVTMIHAAGGFSIRGWITNSPELRRELPEVVPGKVSLDKSPNNGERTLGMIWIPETDELAFDLSFKKLSPEIVEGTAVPTKREFLRFIMSIFDPLGFLCPYTIKSKILLQKVWKSGVGWDERLKEDEHKDWQRWLDSIRELVSMRVPRWYGLKATCVELHVFGDASEVAYAAVAYLVSRDGLEGTVVTMVAGKARVAPLKVVSIPRLELQAAVLACRLACTVQKEHGLSITSRHLWTDSKTVLKWINSDPRDFQKFVSHRLAEIDSKSDVSEWRWVPSAENPADVASKAHWPCNFNLWYLGPEFLLSPPKKWPEGNLETEVETDQERVQKVHAVQQYVPVFDVSRFSSWTRAVRVAARVLAFIGLCRKKQSQSLTAQNVRDAELILYRQVQRESYSEELGLLRTGTALSARSTIRTLDPFLFEDDGLIRVRGRLSSAFSLSFDEKHPIILDGRNPVTQLLIDSYHRRLYHANRETVLNLVREKFWVTQLRRTVKSVINRCQVCRIRRAEPSAPKMADLPAARLEDTRRAFVHCGIDYFGPMEVAIGRRREKRWGVIFTCMVTRAVHLELAPSLSADSAIMAIRRFIARRGQPAVMFSDRGTNFVGADAELRAALRALDTDSLIDYAATKGIEWRMNPPASPHMGGCWERLIRTIKTAMKATLKERAPREEILTTFMTEVEMTINSRPLTYVSSDAEGPVALTPNHLLLGNASGASTLGNFDASDLNGRKAWKKAQALADMFWARWLKEYVPTLQRRQKWVDSRPPVKIGDVVLILDEAQPRNAWPKGIISAVHPGPDGHVRVVTVKTSKGFLKRPVVKIAVLPTTKGV